MADAYGQSFSAEQWADLHRRFRADALDVGVISGDMTAAAYLLDRLRSKLRRGVETGQLAVPVDIEDLEVIVGRLGLIERLRSSVL